jgi:hypothetical protein
MKKNAYVILLLWIAFASTISAKSPKPPISDSAVLVETLEQGSPEYISIKYLEALQASDFAVALKYASRHCVASQEWQMEGNRAIAETIRNFQLTHIAVIKDHTKKEENRCALFFYIKNNIDGKIYWEKIGNWFLKIDGKWVLVHFGEYEEGNLFKKELTDRMFAK